MATSKSGHWFHGMSATAQRSYIAAHPNSVYAKSAKKGAGRVKAPGAAVLAKRATRKAGTAARNEVLKEQDRIERANRKAYKAKKKAAAFKNTSTTGGIKLVGRAPAGPSGMGTKHVKAPTRFKNTSTTGGIKLVTKKSARSSGMG